ncbi:MAG: RHS repeat-associated core domain-containing protein [Ruminococcaceae bacterium]|nr:RHS repeat-associated core domain-containing protein [Oscillospiraceae bacterium]
MKRTIKIISVFLAVLTILGVFSVANPVLAAEVNEDYALTQKIKEIQTEKDEPTIIGEIESKRDRYTKVFQKSDGTSVAVVASTPVHYEENGKWVDIDNTLVEVTENDETVYENKSNDFTVELPQEMDEKDSVSIEKDGYSISFTLDGYDVFEKSQKSKANKKEKTKKEKSKTEIDDSFIDKTETVVYENVGETTDIEYSVTPTGLKENIILTKKPKSEVSYTYTIVAENLNGKANEDGSVSFTDSQVNEIYNIPAPVMFDAKNVVSKDIEVKFSGENGQYKLTYTPSYDWLKNEAKYPVTVDPVLQVVDGSYVDESYIDSANSNTNYGAESYLYSMNTSNREMVSLFNISQPCILGSDAVVKNVTFRVNVSEINSSNNQNVVVGAYPIRTNWTENTVSYSSKPEIGEPVAEQVYPASFIGYKGFDITEIFNNSEQESFYGIALKVKNQTNIGDYVKFSSSEDYAWGNYPYFQIEYYETSGLNNQFDYHKQDVGRAGTVYYNDFSGLIYIEREDMGLYCPYLPVQINSYFNSGSGGSYFSNKIFNGMLTPGYGYGWTTNYNQSIEYVSSIDGGRFLYRDGNNQTIYFKYSGEIVNNKKKWVEDVDIFSSSSGYTLYSPNTTDFNSNLNAVTVEDDDLIRNFNSAGCITKITTYVDSADDTDTKIPYSTKIDYLHLDGNDYINRWNLIGKITDSIGREYRFSYSENEKGGFLLDSIQAYDASGNAVVIGGKPYKMDFHYMSIILSDGLTYSYLTSIEYPDGNSVKYDLYSSSKYLQNVDGYRITISDTNVNPQTIEERRYYSNNSYVDGNVLTVEKVNEYEKVFTDKNGVKKTKQFDMYGRTINTTNSDNCTVIPVVYTEEENTFGEITDKLYNRDYQYTPYTKTNLIKNSSFDYGTNYWNIVRNVSHTNTEDAIANNTNPNSLKITGITDDYLYASQVVEINNGNSGDEYVLEFSVKQTTNSDSDNKTLIQNAVLIETRTNDTGSESWDIIDYVEVNPLNSNWQTYSYKFELENDCNEIKITPCYSLQVGETYYDDIKLFSLTESEMGFLEPEFSNSPNDSDEPSIDVSRTTEGIELSISDGEKAISISDLYSDENWNQQKLTDFNGIETNYLYNISTGLLTNETGDNNKNISYTYNGMGELATVSQTVAGLGTMSTSYSYSGDRISSITHNGFSYNYIYDDWGNIISVKVGAQPLVSYEYDSNNDNVNKITYGNGDYILYTYNTSGEIATIKSYLSTGILKTHYQYTYNNGELSKITDVLQNTEKSFNGKNYEIKDLSTNEIYYSFTESEHNKIENYGGVNYNTNDQYDGCDLVTIATYEDSNSNNESKYYSFSSERDFFGRVENKNMKTFYELQDGDEVDFYTSSEYTYKDLDEETTSLLVESYKSSVGFSFEMSGEILTEQSIEYFYEYDESGNITRIYFKEFEDDGSLLKETTVCSYEYDSAGQLVRENNKTLEKTYVLVYDVGGNIVSKKEYAFTEVNDLSALTPTDTVNYGYDATWKDKLTSFDGNAISYDNMGNPLNYVSQMPGGEVVSGSLTWNGRQLTSVQLENARYEYFYDQDGLRIKTIEYDDSNSVQSVTRYVWHDGVLAGYSIENPSDNSVKTVKILFDDTGDSVGYTFYDSSNNSYKTFYFQKNLQGDIVCVYNSAGSALVTYSYDAWGNVTTKSHGSSILDVLNAYLAIVYTPITYRGYNYDLNTGLYYLQSRYYNPVYGRFLNLDTTEILEKTKGTIHGANLFAYCNNNPVMNVDYTGEGLSLIALALIGGLPGLILVLLVIFGIYSFHKGNAEELQNKIDDIIEQNPELR